MVVIHPHIKSNGFYKNSIFNYFISWNLFLKCFVWAQLVFLLTLVLLFGETIESVKYFFLFSVRLWRNFLSYRWKQLSNSHVTQLLTLHYGEVQFFVYFQK